MSVGASTTVVGGVVVALVIAVCGAGTGVAARQASSVWEGVYTAAQARRGEVGAQPRLGTSPRRLRRHAARSAEAL